MKQLTNGELAGTIPLGEPYTVVHTENLLNEAASKCLAYSLTQVHPICNYLDLPYRKRLWLSHKQGAGTTDIVVVSRSGYSNFGRRKY